MDPTSGLFAGEGHIPLVCTPNASKAAPIEGTVELANVDFSYSMSIRRLNDAPRPSRPFTEEDWLQVEQVAHRVDADLEAQDVRLTMGGEPTFVGIDEPESPQWNIDALGPMKRTRGWPSSDVSARKWRPARCFTLDKGNGIPASRCRVGRLSCFWRATASLSGRILTSSREDAKKSEIRPDDFGLADALQVHRSAHAPSSGELRKRVAGL
jgi:hypothetical protein